MNDTAESTAPAEDGRSLAKIEQSVGAFLMSACFEEITNIRVMWPVMPKQQQEELIERMQRKVEHAVSIAVNRIALQGFDTAAAIIEGLSVKDEAKATLAFARGTEDVHRVVDRVGGKVLLVFADPALYLANMDVIQAQADQPDLPLEE